MFFFDKFWHPSITTAALIQLLTKDVCKRDQQAANISPNNWEDLEGDRFSMCDADYYTSINLKLYQ